MDKKLLFVWGLAILGLAMIGYGFFIEPLLNPSDPLVRDAQAAVVDESIESFVKLIHFKDGTSDEVAQAYKEVIRDLFAKALSPEKLSYIEVTAEKVSPTFRAAPNKEAQYWRYTAKLRKFSFNN